MSETVKVIYEGVNRRGFAIRPGEAIYFVPGMNEIPKEQWDALLKDTDPGGVQHFLDNRQMKLAETLDVNQPAGAAPKQATTIADMSANGAIEEVENAMTETVLAGFRAEEKARTTGRGARKTVMEAIDARQKMFDDVKEAEAEDADKANEGGGGDE